MKKILKGFALSVSMLTTLPFFKMHDFFKGINGYAVMFFPLVGLILGFTLFGIHSLLEPFVASTHLNIIIFALLVLFTGALHLDGFADTIDGLYVKKEKALEVMSDPHIGAMGMIITAVFLILKASTFMLLESFYLLPFILLLSRFNAVLAIYFFPYIGGGMAKLAKDEFSKTQLIFAALFTILLAILLSWKLVLISLLTLVIVSKFFVKRYGGLSGDIYGFTIEVSELILLNIVVFGLI
ncbi:adenosylcobinamide-GDP ribazoletransferase [Sulfurimonas lithotrophica]|uniref:Adenosylcobinamide-GDP ribazoletransferase n=1 Tax=Sulfurimonas lithotrophica TaxID=2590022 RepID=A0A5P8NY06_9BACT|nr:adenosylcobinamide-GDP ribazoletransferase [Sulfurimonas lithotrophica]QFR48290.1 adenosylcobinamide-GDP ribazoletransferase [Sulfurimonas lithotrophica]